eukprot:PITA_15290
MKRMRPEYEVMAQDAVGSAGGIAIIWNPEEVIFENWISLPRILTGMFRLTGMEERILISGVYGPHLPRERKDFLKNMQVIRPIIPGNLWIIGGYFNLIHDLGEKKGGLGSDHWPIRLEIDIKKNNGKKPFRFKTFWLINPEFLRKMEEWWTQSRVKGKGKMHTIQLKLKEIKCKIKKWNKEEFGNIMEEKQKLEKEMEDIQQRIILEGRDEERSKEEGKIINQLEERRKQEEILWRQKSRIKWLREGERNTKIFHQAMIQNRQRNQIFSIKNVEGEWVIEQGGIEKVLVDYHKEILIEPQEARGEAIEYICKEIPRLIKNEQSKALMRATTMEKVEEVVMNMKKGKAPGPDGYTIEFYQAGWHFLGQEILEAVEESRMKQKIWPGINSTFLTLIHKSNKSEDEQGFRPIALCNVIYKIIATLIAKILNPLLY